jgi:hypothetical protein
VFGLSYRSVAICSEVFCAFKEVFARCSMLCIVCVMCCLFPNALQTSLYYHSAPCPSAFQHIPEMLYHIRLLSPHALLYASEWIHTVFGYLSSYLHHYSGVVRQGVYTVKVTFNCTSFSLVSISETHLKIDYRLRQT